jgi:ubiquinone/menaquinone biosynthesis C-methylase UbiE
MNKDYYQEYYLLERNHWWFQVREKIIEDSIKKYTSFTPGYKILNIGAATGRSSEMLSKYGTVTSIEYDKECCEFTTRKTGLEILHGTILSLSFPDDYFDMVCAFDVIEHIEDDSKGVSEMVRVCKSAGNVFITVPAFKQLWSHHDVINHHYRRYKMSQIESLFKACKGSIIFKSYFNSLLFLPIYAFRMSSKIIPEKWIRKDSGSDFSVNNNQVVNRILFKIFSFERFLLKKVRFPAGVSILFMWKKL